MADAVGFYDLNAVTGLLHALLREPDVLSNAEEVGLTLFQSGLVAVHAFLYLHGPVLGFLGALRYLVEPFGVYLYCSCEGVKLLLKGPCPPAQVLPSGTKLLYLALLAVKSASGILKNRIYGALLVLHLLQFLLPELPELCQRLDE